MHFIRAKLANFLLIFLLPVTAAYAYEPDFTVIDNNIVYDVNADGSFVYREDFILRINTQSGVDKISQYPIPFSDSLQELKVIEAYTTTADGEKLEVSKDNIIVQQSPVSNRAPMFSDFKIQYVIFPGVAPGAALHLSYEVKQKKPMYPGEFSAIEMFDITQEYQSAQLTVIVPESYPLHTEAIDIRGGEITSTISGKKMWRWSISDTVAHTPEIGSVSVLDVSPRVVLSSFDSYAAVADAYLARAEDKAKVTPKLQKLADKITRGIDDKRQQAEALYNWVASNIRYVAIFLEYGGVVPHDAETILDSRYGDCKDHVVLLQALLSAKNIKSHPVLINALNNYWLPETAAPFLFNHAITYLPEFDLYVDSTINVAPFAALSPLEVGKTVLVMNTDSALSKLSIIPATQGKRANAEFVSTEIDISDSGKVLVKRNIESSGTMDVMARAQLSQMPRGRGKQLVGVMLNQWGQNGSGDIDMGDPHDLTEAFVYSYYLNLPDYIELSQPGTFQEPMGIPSQSGMISLAGALSLEKREFPIPCSETRREEATTINFPDDITITKLPESRRIENQYGVYQSDYLLEGNSIKVQRKLELTLPATCDSKTYAGLREMAAAMVLDIKAKYSYQ